MILAGKWSICRMTGASNCRRPDHPSGVAGGFFETGRGFYSGSYDAPEEWRGGKVSVEFEGVYMNAEVSLNRNDVTRHPYGYTAFWPT